MNPSVPTTSVFMPDNEPYLGREMLFHFDQMIISCLQQNTQTAASTHQLALTTAQNMACQTISQAISIALSIRELIRQGYLFGAHILERPLAERAAILFYLNLYPQELSIWERGWLHTEAPTLGKMIEAIQRNTFGSVKWKGHEVTDSMNSILHGRPDCSFSSLTSLNGKPAFSPSKLLDRPDLCDEICASTIPLLAIVQGMMSAYFPPTNQIA